MILLWMGSANTWDCDEMGHMNVRVYVEKAMEGIALFSTRLHLGHVFKPGSPSTLIPSEQHIRYIREVRPGRPLSMVGYVLEIGESDTVIYQEMRHGDGTVAAAFRTRLAHIETGRGTPFPWSARTREALESFVETPPAATAPRGIDMSVTPIPDEMATIDEANRLGAPVIGLGMVNSQHCDKFGRMRTPWFMGRVSDSVPNLLYDWRSEIAEAAGARMGAAVLEYRLVYRRWPRAGDCLEIRTSLGEGREKTHSLVHWALDPVSGRAWMTSEALAVTFDLDTRKVLPTPEIAITKLAELAPQGLRI